MIISTDDENAFDKIQYAFMIRMINGMCKEGAYFSIIKGIYVPSRSGGDKGLRTSGAPNLGVPLE